MSALLLQDSTPRRAIDLVLRHGKLLLSFSVLNGIYEVLSRKKFRRYIKEEDVRTFLASLARDAEWIEISVHIAVRRDPKDDKFLELAVFGQAEFIVTGDADLIALHPFRDIQIVTPKAFLERSAS